MLKKSFLLTVLALLMLLIVGCQANEANEVKYLPDFMFSSLEWGDDWETVQKYEFLQNANCEVKENGHRQTVTVKNMEYLGVDIEMVGLVFDVADLTETKGLCNVFLQFAEENEASLLKALTELYGERRSSYLDKNGVENGINPAGWVNSETVIDVLSEEEKEFYVSFLPEGSDQTRLDAALRTPLVSIRFDEERNFIEFNGNAAAMVRFVQSELQK